MADFGMWADDTAYKMRDYYDANRPLTFMEKLFGKRSTSTGCVADELMLGLLLEVVMPAQTERDATDRGCGQ